MRDNELMVLIRTTLLELLSEQGMQGVTVATSYQADNQGRVTTPTLYYFKVMDNRAGWQGRTNSYDPDTGKVTVEQRQWIRSTFQIQGLASFDKNDLYQDTAEDLTRMAAMLVQSESFRLALRAKGVGMERVTEIRSPQFVNDRDQFQASPSFDFTVSRQDRIIQQSPVLEAVEINQTRV